MNEYKRTRIKFMIVNNNWFLGLNSNNEIQRYCQIDDGISFYSEYEAIQFCKKCISLGINCSIIKYKIKYTPMEEIRVLGVSSYEEPS